jgi:hypothetical protein
LRRTIIAQLNELGTRIFVANLRGDISGERASDFSPHPSKQAEKTDGRGPMQRSTKQRFELICDQTNTKQTSNKVRAGRFNVFVSS